jgi:LuxR family maltose regulon positive regulatory protein
LQQAEELLQAYRQQNENQRNTRQLIDILPLQALVYHKQELFDEALATLEQAVILAQPGGFIRPFVEPGPELADLLNRLHSQGVAQDYIAQILAAFSQETKDKGRPTVDKRDESVGRPSSSLIEPLTDRELEVLTLLAQRLTYKEIAAQLIISPGTVTQHVHNVYQKLEVKRRKQAVAKATDLGLLSSN